MRNRLRYGIEAPYVPMWLGLGAVVCLVLALVWHDWFWFIPCAVLALGVVSFCYTTLVGKHRVWAQQLDGLGLRGDEHALDLGCGRGAVLVATALRLPHGTAAGIDLWRSHDQSGNTEDSARQNAAEAGVADRVALHTGDITALPFPDASFDLVTSALAVHNIKRTEDRRRAIEEAARVLRPGGRLLLADFQGTRDYAEWLSPLAYDVRLHWLGWRYWYGGPWAATRMVTGTRVDAPTN